MFCTNDWGSKESTFISGPMFERFFLPRYRELVAAWSTPEGGFIVFNYGKGSDIGVSDAITHEMFREFARQMNYWSPGS